VYFITKPCEASSSPFNPRIVSWNYVYCLSIKMRHLTALAKTHV
jgi:hypothetical protein